MTTASRRAEQADRDRLLGIDGPGPWHCPLHLACICPPPQPLEHCPEHGPYRPRGMDASCGACEADRRDADHTHRWQLDARDYYRHHND